MKRIVLLFLFLFIFTVTLFSQPDSPILIDPPTETDLVELNVTLDWTDVTGALYYSLDISTEPDFSSLVNGIQSQILVSYFTCHDGMLNSNTEYYWRVRAMTSSGFTNYSVVFNFRTIGTPLQEITNLVNYINEFVNSNQLNNVQGNILRNRLSSAEHQINLNHSFAAIIHLSNFISRVWMLEENDLISVTNGNKLIYNATGIIELIGGDSPPQISYNNVPDIFSLEQNYPNPFNPSTTIEYSIPQGGIVNLIIYDITGKEVAEIVNKFQNAGSYIVTWDASGFSSGVYFYKLITNDKIAVKRMILTK